MPKALERKLWARMRKPKYRRWSASRKRAYVYGTLRKTGWVPRHQRHSNPHWRDVSYPRVSSRGYKKCLINTLSRIKFTTPKSARVAFRRATQKCRKKITYKRR